MGEPAALILISNRDAFHSPAPWAASAQITVFDHAESGIFSQGWEHQRRRLDRRPIGKARGGPWGRASLSRSGWLRQFGRASAPNERGASARQAVAAGSQLLAALRWRSRVSRQGRQRARPRKGGAHRNRHMIDQPGHRDRGLEPRPRKSRPELYLRPRTKRIGDRSDTSKGCANLRTLWGIDLSIEIIRWPQRLPPLTQPPIIRYCNGSTHWCPNVVAGRQHN
jgi:hypothetical protein